MTDVTEHPTREGKVYCCVVLDAFSCLVPFEAEAAAGAAVTL
jgi:putative transposase